MPASATPSTSSSSDSSSSSRPVMNALAPYMRAANPATTAQATSDPQETGSGLARDGGVPASQDGYYYEDDDGDDEATTGSRHRHEGHDEAEESEERTMNLSSHSSALNRPRDEVFDEVERRARMALENIATREDDVEPHLGEYVEVLQTYRTACQQRSMYREAYLVQQVLRNLRLEEESRHVRGITEQQMEERRMLEEAHREEFREFHHSWNARIDAFEEEQLEAEIALLERQNNELIQFQEDMRDYQPRLLKYSRSLLESRLKQQTLARQRDYVGAQAQKEMADALEMGDMERYESARMEAFERREYALRHRHQQELLALRSKVESRRLYLERYRKQELDVLLQRYINIRRSMESQQNIVRNKTGTMLLKHACNMKTDSSGTAVLVESAGSGTFGTVVQRRQADELRAAQSQSDAYQ